MYSKSLKNIKYQTGAKILDTADIKKVVNHFKIKSLFSAINILSSVNEKS